MEGGVSCQSVTKQRGGVSSSVTGRYIGGGGQNDNFYRYVLSE